MKLAALLLLLLKTIGALAQTASVNVGLTMPSVALVDILTDVSPNVNLKMTAPAEAGSPIVSGAANSSQWLVFTSAVTPGGSRNIRGQVTGSVPAGIRLKLVVSPYVGAGQGFTGGNSYITGNTYLTSTPANFISSIKGAFTGTGYGTSGFKLTYSLEIENYANVRSGITNLTVLYTIADN
ncbi:hypothetical protein [Dyadobacter aurulentus]|uniref:hypothetical protein n=1 Tax=Dyadobacter sp. UC 10 TaxID=2605428 RepID=UPI0011F384DE|nr:hypothetical protein [Dyadobacter sp. UC 10]KAA0992841.1 hypothetical protein FXO21_23030 [Dyadobacter sp. UC 10]